MITLVLVNYQNDFITGTMSTKASKNILPEVRKYIKEHKDEIEKIIFVMDWHPYNYTLFKKYGGELQPHCIKHTPGACIEPKLLKYIHSLEINTEYLLKVNEEAFWDIEMVNDALGKKFYIDDEIIIRGDNDVVVAGISNDTLHILKNMEGTFKPKIFIKGIYTTDNKLITYINSKELEKV